MEDADCQVRGDFASVMSAHAVGHGEKAGGLVTQVRPEVEARVEDGILVQFAQQPCIPAKAYIQESLQCLHINMITVPS
jgi:hypothetical protein